MSTAFVVVNSILYIFGVYFFFIKKDYLGSRSIPLRVLCFVFSPIMVLGLFYEILEDWVKRAPMSSRGTTSKLPKLRQPSQISNRRIQ